MLAATYIYCIDCGATAGARSECLHTSANKATPHHRFKESSNDAYCINCGAKPGSPSLCTIITLGAQVHQWKEIR